MVCDAVLSDTQIPTSWWNLAFPSSGLEGKNSCILKRGGHQVPPNCLGLSTKHHGITSRDFILNKLKSPLQITCLGFIYMSTRVAELRIEFLKYALSFVLVCYKYRLYYLRKLRNRNCHTAVLSAVGYICKILLIQYLDYFL